MTPTQLRDKVVQVAKTDESKAAEIAERISDPWFQAQAWAHVARYADEPRRFARKAAKAAAKTKDDYQRSAVRAWEIAALAERGHTTQAQHALVEAVDLARTVRPPSSRAEALLLLLQAAFKVSDKYATDVANILETSCASTHWREVRARRYAAEMLNGETPPREFFW